MTAEPLPLSHSALNTLSACGVKYAFRYIDKRHAPLPLHMIVGRAADAGISSNLQRKIDSDALMSQDEVADVTATAFDQEAGREEIVVEAGDDLLRVLGHAKDRAVSAALTHHLGIAPSLSPRSVQRWFEIDVPTERGPVVLRGRTDVEEVSAVIDTKCTKRNPPANAADISEQLTLYALAKNVDVEVPTMERRVALAHVVFVGDGIAAPVVQWSHRGPSDYRRVLRRVESAANVIRAGAFTPANPDDWRCTAKFCEFWNVCPYAVRPVTVQATAPGD